MKEEIIKSIEGIDIAASMIGKIRKMKKDIRITVFTNQIFGAEFTAEEMNAAIEWIKFRQKDLPINLGKIEFLDSEEKPLYFIKPKKEDDSYLKALTKKCAACEECKVRVIQQIPEKQLWAILEMKKRSGVLHFVTENGCKMCTTAALPTHKLFDVLHKSKAKFFCFGEEEAYYITKK